MHEFLTPDNNHQPLKIWQQNVNRSLNSQTDLLVSLKAGIYDIYAIHEPYINFHNKSRANFHWSIIYPSTHDTKPKTTRSIILINATILTNTWKQIPIPHPDITAIKISGTHSMLKLFNIYNDYKKNDSLDHLLTYHPLWDKPHNIHLFTKHNLEMMQPLLDMVSKFNMKMVLPPSILTLRAHSTGNLTRVDNVFCSETLLDDIIKCTTEKEACPIKTDKLDFHMPKLAPEPRLNFHDVKWPEFINTLKTNLSNLPLPTVITNTNVFYQRLNDLNVWCGML